MEVFQRAATQLAGVFSADTGRLAFGSGIATTLVQNLNGQYSQNVARLYEVGTIGQLANVYYVGGRAQGQMGIQRVVGPSVLIAAYYNKYGNVCNARTNNMQFSLDQPDCSLSPNNPQAVGTPLQYLSKFCVITGISISVTSQDMIVNEGSQIMFSGLEYNGR